MKFPGLYAIEKYCCQFFASGRILAKRIIADNVRIRVRARVANYHSQHADRPERPSGTVLRPFCACNICTVFIGRGCQLQPDQTAACLAWEWKKRRRVCKLSPGHQETEAQHPYPEKPLALRRLRRTQPAEQQQRQLRILSIRAQANAEQSVCP